MSWFDEFCANYSCSYSSVTELHRFVLICKPDKYFRLSRFFFNVKSYFLLLFLFFTSSASLRQGLISPSNFLSYDITLVCD